MKTFLYFQPEYVRDFVCDSSKCNDNCCELNWDITIDEQTYERYRQIQPASKARAITSCFEYNAEAGKGFLKNHPCPFLTDEKLCRLQLEYGEQFLSQTCVTYPRRTLNFGNFFERSLMLSCPVAARMILLSDKPISFEFVEVSEPEHSHDGKIYIAHVYAGQTFAKYMLEIQIAMISILQERTLSIDGRLIVLGFFVDKLDELIADGLDENALTKLLAAYESKKFLSEQLPRMLASVQFDEKKFSALMLELVDKLDNEKFSATRQLLASRRTFADERKIFTARRANFMENFLVNELFMTCFPWKFQASAAKNFGFFVAQYKLFEFLVFAAARKNFDEDFLLDLTVWFTRQTEHNDGFAQIIFDSVPEDIFDSLEALTDA